MFVVTAAAAEKLAKIPRSSLQIQSFFKNNCAFYSVNFSDQIRVLNKTSNEDTRASFEVMMGQPISTDHYLVGYVPTLKTGEELATLEAHLLYLTGALKEQNFRKVMVEVSASNRKVVQLLYRNQFQMHQQSSHPTTGEQQYLMEIEL